MFKLLAKERKYYKIKTFISFYVYWRFKIQISFVIQVKNQKYEAFKTIIFIFHLNIIKYS